MKRIVLIVVVCLVAGVGGLLRYRMSDLAPAVSVSKPLAARATPISVTVAGAVRLSGAVTLSRPSLREALLHAEPTTLARLDKITIVRAIAGAKKAFVARADSGETDDSFPLRDGDTIYVPERLL